LVDTRGLVSLSDGFVLATLQAFKVEFTEVGSFLVGLDFEELFDLEFKASTSGFFGGVGGGFLGLSSQDFASALGLDLAPPFSGTSLPGEIFLFSCFFMSFFRSPTEGSVLGKAFGLPLGSAMVSFGGIIIL